MKNSIADSIFDQNVYLEIDHQRASLNPVSNRIIRRLILGMITELKGCNNPADIHLILDFRSPEPARNHNGSSPTQATVRSSSEVGNGFLGQPFAVPVRRPSLVATRKLSLFVDQKPIPLKPFIENMLFNTVHQVVAILLQREEMTILNLRLNPKEVGTG